MVNTTLTITSLNFRIHNDHILRDISCQLSGPSVVSLLGPNGAGKSTLLKCLSAQCYATTGRVALDDLDTENQRGLYLKRVGYMPETPMLMPELTVAEQLLLVTDAKNIDAPQQAIDRVIEMCHLATVLHKRTRQLSLGYRQRLNLAQAIINQPSLLIMDEPLNGLDPHLIIELRRLVKQLKEHTLIIMSTHYLAEAQTISDRVLMMQGGRLLDNIDIQTLTKEQNLEQLYLQHTIDQSRASVNESI